MQYDFRPLEPYTGEEVKNEPIEGFVFNGFDTRKNGWWLVERNAPLPDEQEVIESVPYKQGSEDFSIYRGDRFFKQREIEYKLVYFGKNGNYEDRKEIEQDLKRSLSPYGRSPLYDTHDMIYHWQGKVKDISVDDNESNGTLTATVTFDCYPFAIRNNDEFDDLWDEVYFPHWIFMDKRYTIDGKTTVDLDNIGSRMMEVSIKVISGTVKYDELTINTGKSYSFSLHKGKNSLVFDGNGIIELSGTREEMI